MILSRCVPTAACTLRSSALGWGGDAPPEDVGGVYGFERFLDTLGNPEDEEHDGMVEWAEDQMWARFTLNRHRERLFRWHKHRDMMLHG